MLSFLRSAGIADLEVGRLAQKSGGTSRGDGSDTAAYEDERAP